MISDSVLLVQGGLTSLENRLESESSQDMSQDSIFGSKKETRAPKIPTVGWNLDEASVRAFLERLHPVFRVFAVVDWGPFVAGA